MGQAVSVEWATVLDLKGLVVEARPRPSLFDRWFNTRISVVARPFGGVLETIFTKEDLIEFADALRLLDPVGEVSVRWPSAVIARRSYA
jgi:hypothetical protein